MKNLETHYNCHTSKISKYVDHYIQHLAKQVKSYKSEITDFLRKYMSILSILQNFILVSINIKSECFKIKHDQRILALKESLKQ